VFLIPDDHQFSADEVAAVYRAIALRRDMRHFRSDPVPAATLERLLQAAHLAPSVGFMQPWRFVRITDGELRRAIHDLVEAERKRTADELGPRRSEFLKLKVEGILECGELLVVALMDGRDRYVFGRRTLPEMDVASAACAIQNVWLTARVEGLGMGWVSIFDPEALARLLDMPEGARPLAVLCLGYVDEFYDRPMLEQEGWDDRRDLSDLVGENRWPAGPVPPEASPASATGAVSAVGAPQAPAREAGAGDDLALAGDDLIGERGRARGR
jgi:5,6-dimethylbenzimidazole synthase